MKTGDSDKLVPTTTGGRLLTAILSGAATGAMIGTATHYAVHFLIPTASSGVTTQIIAFEVYVLLTVALAVAFKPVQLAPLGLRFTSFRDLGLAFVTWLGLEWLRRYFSNVLAIIISAVLFAAMHLYPIVMPYTFVTGLFTGWIRVRTGSTLNTVFMHVLNNCVFLYLGFLLLR